MPSVLIGLVSILLPLAVAFLVKMFAEYPPEKQDMLDDADSMASDDTDEVNLVRFRACNDTDRPDYEHSGLWRVLWTERRCLRRRRRYLNSDMWLCSSLRTPDDCSRKSKMRMPTSRYECTMPWSRDTSMLTML